MEPSHPSLTDTRLLQQVLELSAIGTVITDALQADHPIVYANPAFERLTGYLTSEILGRNCRFLQAEDHDQPGIQEIRQALIQKQAVTVTLRNYRRDGTLFYNEVTLSALRDKRGQVTHFVGYQNDVTAREEAAFQATQVHQQLLTALERVTDGFVTYDRDLNFAYVNAAAARISGRRPEDVIGRRLLTVFPELTDSTIVQTILRAQKTGVPENVVDQRFGRWIDSTVYPAENGVSVFDRDITDWYQTEERLLKSEDYFNRIFQACPIAIIVSWVSDHRYIDANSEFYRQSGYSREEVIGRTVFDLDIWADPFEREIIGDVFQEKQEVRNHEVHFRLKSGAIVDAVVSIVPVILDDQHCRVTLIRNITADKHAQQQLQTSEERYRRLAAELQRTLDLSLDLITSVDKDGRFVTVSAASQQILGYLPEELVGCAYIDFVHPEDRMRTRELESWITTGHTATAFQNRCLHKNGMAVWMEWTAAMVPGESLMSCVGRDITERRVAEEDQAFLAAIVQASQDAVLGLRLDSTIRSWNAGAEHLYGYSETEARGQPMSLIVPAELQPEEEDVLRQAGRGERPSPFESVRQAKNGHQVPVLVTASPIFDAAGRVIGVSKIARNITERKAAEAQIQSLNQDLQLQLKHLTGIREIDQMITSSEDLTLTLDRILDQFDQQLGADAVTLLLLEGQTLNLKFGSAHGFATSLEGETLHIGFGLAGEVALSRQPMTVLDLQAIPLMPAWREVVTRERLTAYYAVPLIAKEKVLGVIEVLHREPFAPSDAWLETFEMLAGQAAIAIDNAQLFQNLEQSNLDLRLAYDETIEGWARALDLRDKETEGHSRRVTEMTVRLCQDLGLSPEELVEVRRGALLHDIGKMGIPDAVLLKPGKLTEEEWRLMRRHPEYAVALLSPIRFLRPALDIPQFHHERWDGSGYPQGLSGEAIPLTARAFAVVDVYDALTSNRPYRAAWSRDRTLTHLRAGAGTHFDPKIVETFFQLLSDDAL